MKEKRRHEAFQKMVADAKKERRAEKARMEAEQKVIASTSENWCIDNEESGAVKEREAAQEALVESLTKEVDKTSRKRTGGKRRTKCVIAETDNGHVAEGMRSKCVIKEVSGTDVTQGHDPPKAAWLEGDTGAVAAALETGSKRKLKQRKDREARLR